jgi:uncharacterized protein YkwD
MNDWLRGMLCVCLAGSAWLAPARAEDKFQLAKQEQELVDLTNKERAKKNLPPLKVDPALTKAARQHSANMAKQEKMEHILDGKRPEQRAEAAGYRLGWVGENIAAGEQWTLPGLMSDWMGSKPHRENILSKRYTEIGVGMAKTAKNEWYYTLLFGRPRR